MTDRLPPRRRTALLGTTPGRATGAIVIVLALALSLTAACGSTSDPFVGSWTIEALPEFAYVVVKLDQDYYATIVQDGEPAGWLPYARAGNELSRDMSTNGQAQIWRLVSTGDDTLVLKVAGTPDVTFTRSSSPLPIAGP